MRAAASSGVRTTMLRVWIIERYPPVRVLIQRIVRSVWLGHGLVIQRRILHVNCHAHNYARAEGFKSGSDRVPQRLSIGKESMCELAIDDGDTSGVWMVSCSVKKRP